MRRRALLGYGATGLGLALVPGAFKQVKAQTRTVTLQAPPGVPDGWFFLLFGQGEGSSYRVQGGRIVIPWDLGAQATFGNFGNAAQLSQVTQWLKVENLSSLPPGGWTATIEQGRLVYGSQLAFDSVESFVDGNTFALVGPVADNQATRSSRA